MQVIRFVNPAKQKTHQLPFFAITVLCPLMKRAAKKNLDTSLFYGVFLFPGLVSTGRAEESRALL
jgi:hypothetical protein